MTRVINIKSGEPFDIYIGRFHKSPKYGLLPRSKWANEPLPKDATAEQRAESIASYRARLIERADLMAALPELRGNKTVGCWCAPLPCHGDVLVELAEA